MELLKAYPLKASHPASLQGSKQEKTKSSPSVSHSPRHTVGNHFSCDLLFRLEAQDTDTLPFSLVCIAGAGDRDSKNNSAQEKLIHWNETLWSVPVSNFTESRNSEYAPFSSPALISSIGEFPKLCSLLSPEAIPPFTDTAEPRLSKERVRTCKTHNHEAEIRMKGSPRSTAL